MGLRHSPHSDRPLKLGNCADDVALELMFGFPLEDAFPVALALEEEVAHHSAHCFNYLRQGIMCNADTTLEGKTDAGPGEGSEHECVDYDALLQWANKHGAYRWRNGLLPDTAIL